MAIDAPTTGAPLCAPILHDTPITAHKLEADASLTYQARHRRAMARGSAQLVVAIQREQRGGMSVGNPPKLPPTKAVPDLPENFAKNFIEGGWRRLERVYGCRDDVILAWMAMCGGLEVMQQRRRQFLRERAKRYVLGRTLTAVGKRKSSPRPTA